MAGNEATRNSAGDQIFGKIAVKNQLLSEAQLKECVALLEQGDAGDLAKMVVSKGFMTAEMAAKVRSKAEQLASGGAESGAGNAAASTASRMPATPAKGAVSVKEVAARDYSQMKGKPLGEYLKLARSLGASDFHFQVDSPPYIRLHGHIVPLKHPVLTAADTECAIRDLLDEDQWRHLTTKQDFDYCYEREDHGRYRTNVFQQRRGYDVVFRLIPQKVPTLAELNLPESLLQFTTYRQGIVLITGPAGCGKSATMAALVDTINQERYDHIVTVEDPIEILFQSKNCNVNQRHVYRHTDSFQVALRSALRADPDVIMVGEMRDLETISMAITAAETGHLVLATLHTTNAIRSIDRIIDVFPPKEQDQIRAMVSESMRGVISQQLIPRADGMGRAPALEIMFSTPAVANLIRERKTYQLPSVLQTGKHMGMCTMEESLRELLNRGVITKEQALFHAEDPSVFKS
ncbi:MAG: type IV pilus twitching motility protein PilT [Planctomycetes bacterium]|nr:type IV pilus twitching motility protein PilT [Planctomycetota bacterium]